MEKEEEEKQEEEEEEEEYLLFIRTCFDTYLVALASTKFETL